MFIPELAVGLYRIVEVSSRRYVEQTQYLQYGSILLQAIKSKINYMWKFDFEDVQF